MNRKYLLPLLALLASASPLSAMAADWVVAKVSQPSSYTEDRKNWVTLKPGMTVKNRSWISTGPRGRVVLERAKDRVTFQPNTLAGVYERAGMAVHTDFAQQTGVIRLEIDPKKKPHLAVQTPFLAAVVKGTVFTVSVDRKGAKVGVERGRVDVTDALSGERTGVKAGQQAAVDNNPATPMSLSGTNTDFEPVVTDKPFTPAIPAPQPATRKTVSTETTTSVEDTPTETEVDTSTDTDTGKTGTSGKGTESDGSGKGGTGKGGTGKGGDGKGGTGKGGDGKGGTGKGGGGKGGDGKDGDGKGGTGKDGDGKGGTGKGGGGKDGDGKGGDGKEGDGKDGDGKGKGKGSSGSGASGNDSSSDDGADSSDDGDSGKGKGSDGKSDHHGSDDGDSDSKGKGESGGSNGNGGGGRNR